MAALTPHQLAWLTRRGGRPWPKVCCGPEWHQHIRGCRKTRPFCRWRRAASPRHQTCRCGTPHYPHRVGTVDYAHKLVCAKHPEFDRLQFELISGLDWETGEPL